MLSFVVNYKYIFFKLEATLFFLQIDTIIQLINNFDGFSDFFYIHIKIK